MRNDQVSGSAIGMPPEARAPVERVMVTVSPRGQGFSGVKTSVLPCHSKDPGRAGLDWSAPCVLARLIGRSKVMRRGAGAGTAMASAGGKCTVTLGRPRAIRLLAPHKAKAANPIPSSQIKGERLACHMIPL